MCPLSSLDHLKALKNTLCCPCWVFILFFTTTPDLYSLAGNVWRTFYGNASRQVYKNWSVSCKLSEKLFNLFPEFRVFSSVRAIYNFYQQCYYTWTFLTFGAFITLLPAWYKHSLYGVKFSSCYITCSLRISASAIFIQTVFWHSELKV